MDSLTIASIALTLGLEDLVRNKPQCKQPALEVYSSARAILVENRINVDLQSQFTKRKDFFQPHFKLESISNDKRLAVVDEFFMDKPTTAHVQKMYDMVKDSKKGIQPYARGSAGALYVKDKKKERSGEYDDIRILGEILTALHTKAINSNYEKAVSSRVADWKKKQLAAGDTITAANTNKAKKEANDELKDYYDKEKQKIPTRAISHVFVAFVICGVPGNDLLCLQIETGEGLSAKDKQSRETKRLLEATAKSAGKKGRNDENENQRATALETKNRLKEEATRLFMRHNRRDELMLLRELEPNNAEVLEELLLLLKTPFKMSIPTVVSLTPQSVSTFGTKVGGSTIDTVEID
jgi:hypothetical protein